MGTLQHIHALKQLLFSIFPTITHPFWKESFTDWTCDLASCEQKRQISVNIHSPLTLQSEMLLKTRRLSSSGHTILFNWSAPVLSLHSKFPLPIQHFSAKKKKERKTRDDWFSVQIKFHLHREVLVWTVGEVLRFGEQVVFFQQNEQGGFLSLISGLAVLGGKQTHQVWAHVALSTQCFAMNEEWNTDEDKR